MKKIIVIGLIYISGYITSYILIKKDSLIEHNYWTNTERIQALLLSTGSWFSVIGEEFNHYLVTEGNKESKW